MNHSNTHHQNSPVTFSAMISETVYKAVYEEVDQDVST